MVNQPDDVDQYVITMLGEGDLIGVRGDKIKARNRVWLKLDSIVLLNEKKVGVSELGRELKYILTNPDQLEHLPENKDSAVVFLVPTSISLETFDPKSKRAEIDSSVKRIFAKTIQDLYPENYNQESLPWTERPSVRLAFNDGPPPPEVKLPYWSDEEPDLNKLNPRNVFDVLVNKDNELLVRGKKTELSALTEMAKAFISNPDSSAEMAESPKHAIISLKNDRGTNYEAYLKVYNALKAAYDELWDEKAQELYGKPYSDDMPFEQRRAIKSAIPMVISEAEPSDF